MVDLVGPDASAVTDQLAVQPQATNVAWWKSPPNLIAVFAFALSLSTSLISLYAYRQKDIHDQQMELSSIVDKLANLPLRRAEFFSSHSGDELNGIDQVFVIQNNMLARQGLYLSLSLGTSAPASELASVATALRLEENHEAAIKVFRLAVEASDNYSDEVASRRGLGTSLIASGLTAAERSEGDRAFEEALNIGLKYPAIGNNPGLLAYTNAYTEQYWAEAWSLRDCKPARIHLDRAKALYPELVENPATDELKRITVSIERFLGSCVAGPPPLAPAAPPLPLDPAIPGPALKSPLSDVPLAPRVRQ